MKNSSGLSCGLLAAAALLPLASAAFAAEKPAATVATGWQKPAWLADLSAGVKESYDDNVLAVSGDGMAKHGSSITTLAPKVGFNFAPLLGAQKTLTTLSLVYAPEFNFYQEASSESYNAHKLANVIKGKSGDFSFSLDNAFLFNDGDNVGPVYALNQGAAGTGQLDKNRSAYATAYARERRRQIQDRTAIVFQYDLGQFFLRPTASFLYYDFMTDLHKTSAAPYKGYQNYADRSDVNGGLDLGYNVVKDIAFTVGYRFGHQDQQAYDATVDAAKGPNGGQQQSSADYQRVLFGFEGKPLKWLTAKLAMGPEFRAYNGAAPVADANALNYYGEASLTAAIDKTQTLAFSYKHWQWVSSTGKIPYADNTFALTYHWNVTKQLGLDLGAKYLYSDYNCGSTAWTGGSNLRNDAVYVGSIGVSYAFTPHLSANVGYAADLGRNQQDNAVAADYRNYDRQLVSLGVNYKF